MGDWRMAVATGLAAQPPAYRVPAVQQGADATFEIEQQTERWRWRSGAFYRRGWDRVSFSVDDVELRYAPASDSQHAGVGR